MLKTEEVKLLKILIYEETRSSFLKIMNRTRQNKGIELRKRLCLFLILPNLHMWNFDYYKLK